MQRRNAKWIARQKQPLPRPVEKRDGKLSIELLDKSRTGFFVKVRDDFDVRLRVELMAFLDQVAAQLHMVEDFAIADDHNRAVFILHGLTAAGRVDDAQPLNAQAERRVDERGRLIRPPVM